MSNSDDVKDVTDIKEPYFIMKQSLYFKPNCAGYTENIARAGLYEKEFALDYKAKSKAYGADLVIVKPCSETTWSVEEIDTMIETLQVIRNAKLKKA